MNAKLRGGPVYALLDGNTKDRLPVYCTTARPDIAKAQGFVGAKIPCPYGPAHGDSGFVENLAFFERWRSAGGRTGLSADARLLHVAQRAVYDPSSQSPSAAWPQMDRGVSSSRRLQRLC
eukprot:6211832-Pleurochrysis_carterae.AAC.2